MMNYQLVEGFEDLLNIPMEAEDCWAGRLVAQGEGETYSPQLRDGKDIVPDEETQVVAYVTVAQLNSPNTTYVKFANGQIAKFSYELLAYPENYENLFRLPEIESVTVREIRNDSI